jgi:hypothetical protein
MFGAIHDTRHAAVLWSSHAPRAPGPASAAAAGLSRSSCELAERVQQQAHVAEGPRRSGTATCSRGTSGTRWRSWSRRGLTQ